MKVNFHFILFFTFILLTGCGSSSDEEDTNKDNTPPVITLLGEATVTIEQGLTYTDAGATAADNIDNTLFVSTDGNVDTLITGSYSIIYTATDNAGNSVSTTRTVIVTPDITPPVITLLGEATVTIEQGLTYTDAGATAADNIDNTLFVSTDGNVDTLITGSYSIIYTATDNAGNSVSITRTVIVTPDITPPVITLIGNDLISIEQGSTYTDKAATATDNVDDALVVSKSGIVDTLNTGSYTITYTATDNAGNSVSTDRTVIVTPDISPPIITLIGNDLISIEQGSVYVEEGATATDHIDEFILVNTDGYVDTSTIGSYTIDYTATDIVGNTTTVTRRIDITPDITPPFIALLDSASINIERYSTYAYIGAEAKDNFDETVVVYTTGTVNTSVLGAYTVIYTVTDAAGNTATVNQIVNVVNYLKIVDIPFSDANLQSCILNIANNEGWLLISEMVEVRCIYKSIIDLTGIENLTSLTRLTLYKNEITDISALANLRSLTYLSLDFNKITDLPASTNLISLAYLSLNSNSIADISVITNMTSLTKLRLNRNRITDLSALVNLTSLTSLALEFNLITDISALANLTLLTFLDLGGNSVSDISILANYTTIYSLYLHDNSITDISVLTNLTDLRSLRLKYNSITDISALEGLARLSTLELGGNLISDISALANLPLIELELYDNSISDISALSNLTSLRELSISYNSVSDISALENLKSITTLSLSKNLINEISVLNNLTSITKLSLDKNTISDISSLANMTLLTSLWINDNDIRDISALLNKTSLVYLYASNNSITEIPSFSNLTSLITLILEENQITDISSLSNSTTLRRLDLGGNAISDISSLVKVTSLKYLYLDENQIINVSFLEDLTSLIELSLKSNDNIQCIALDSLVANLNVTTVTRPEVCIP